MGQARKIVHRSTKRVVGSIPFPDKNPEPIEWESRNERDAIYLLGFLKEISFIASQPLKFEYLDTENVVRVHFPDLQVNIGTRKYLIEVKPEKRVKDFESRTSLIKPQARAKGFEYIVLDTSVIHVFPRLSNIKLLLRYRSIQPSAEIRSLVTAIFSEVHECTIAELQGASSLPLEIIYSLLVHYMLQTNLHLPINNNSIIQICTNFAEFLGHEEILGEGH